MASPTLFTPLALGTTTLSHRIALAPLTRFRASADHVPLPLVADYYSQRGAVPGTLLVTEATFISPRAGGFPNAPGIYTAAQIAGWRHITSAVHARGSTIFLQLWALGRAANAPFLASEGGHSVVSASALPFPGGDTPRPLTDAEIHEYIADYAQAARNAIEAGFDGVEIHGANGYLVDQFLQDVSNTRTDAWGGSVERRARFGLEVARAVVAAVGADRTAIRLSPYSHFQGMGMADAKPTFTYMVAELRKLDLAYLHLVEARIDGITTVETTESVRYLVEAWGRERPVLLAGGFSGEMAKAAVEEEYKGYQVVVVFGRMFISNPDLPFRIQNGVPLTPYNRDTFYSAMQAEGYTDYPFSKEYQAVESKI